MARKKVAVIFGGNKRRALSCRSAANVIRALPEALYEAIPIGINSRGGILYFPGSADEIETDNWENTPDCCRCSFSLGGAKPGLFKMLEDGETAFLPLDCVIPILYGAAGTEGQIQGLIRLGKLPFVGSGVTACAISSDRDYMDAVLRKAGIETIPSFTAVRGRTDISLLADEIQKTVFYPVAVSTAHSKRMEGQLFATNEKELDAAVKKAFVYDSRVLVEKAVSGSQVICAVLGGGEATASPLAEMVWEDDSVKIPASLSQELSYKARETAVSAFQALGCCGMAEVILVIDPLGKVMVKEVNALPDYSDSSVCLRLFESVGVTAGMLFDKLIALAEEQAELSQ